MKQHSWLGGFDWDKLVTQSLAAPYRPDTSFDRTDVKGENMRKAVHEHINSKPIAITDQHHFHRSVQYIGLITAKSLTMSPVDKNNLRCSVSVTLTLLISSGMQLRVPPKILQYGRVRTPPDESYSIDEQLAGSLFNRPGDYRE